MSTGAIMAIAFEMSGHIILYLCARDMILLTPFKLWKCQIVDNYLIFLIFKGENNQLDMLIWFGWLAGVVALTLMFSKYSHLEVML